MTTSYTSLLGLALPVTGELQGTWGDTVNSYITQYLDAAVAGTQTISGSQTAVTLSVTTGSSLSQAGSGATGSSQYQIINCTGNPASLLTITAPAASKVYLILNSTSTAQSVKIVGTGPTTGVTVATGKAALVAWNGSDFTLVATNDASKISGVLAAANGGTGQSSYTTGDLLYASGSTALSKLGIGTALQVLKVNAGATAPEWVSGAALTKVDDTNVTLTLGGTPATSLLAATSLTLGWTGQLSLGRGGTNANLTASAGSVAYSTASAIAFTAVGSSNQVLISNGTSAPSWSNLSSIGVTTFSAGTTGFTPSTATSGAITLAGTLATTNGGTGLTSFTANGVVYASSTSALTTGSALTFNGTNLVSGTVQATSANGFYITNNAASDALQVISRAAGTDNIEFGNTGTGTSAPTAYIWDTRTGGEQMRLTSTGLGIGTNSPGNKLDVNGTINVAINIQGTGTDTTLYNATGDMFVRGGTGKSLKLGANNTNSLAILDSSGNLGLGVTPNTSWQSTWTALQVGSGISIATLKSNSGNQALEIGSNYYVNAGYKYQASSTATRYEQDGGTHAWYTAASGTAGNAISFSQVMTLAATGNLSVGTTTDAARIYSSTAASGIGFATYSESETAERTTYSAFAGFQVAAYQSANGSPYTKNTDLVSNSDGTVPSTMRFWTKTSGASSPAERVRIDSSGNVGIGTSSPDSKLYVVSGASSTLAQLRIGYNGTSVNYYDANTHYFRDGSGPTNRMILDSSGNLGLGVTPSAWTTNWKAFQLSATSALSDFSGQSSYWNNTVVTGGTTPTYQTTAAASFYRQTTGQHLWYNAPSGTAGTAITFTQVMTLDASGQLGIGTSSPNYLFSVQANSVQMGMSPQSGVGYLGNYSNAALAFVVNNSEKARIDTSGNLGIGTSSPASTLDVRTSTGATIIAGRTSNVGATSVPGALNFTAPNASGSARTWAGLRAVVGTATTGSESASLIFSNQVAGAYNDSLILDTSGNLGLGVTPSAWGSAWRAFDLGANSSVAQSGAGAGDLTVAWNAYNNGTNWIYKYTGGAAARYRVNEGTHAWFYAASGTAGNAISFTQAMTLDASGNLLVGRTSQSISGVKVDAEGLFGSIKSGNWSWSFGASSSINAFVINDTTTGSSTERARITSGGDLLVGQTTQSATTVGFSVNFGQGATIPAVSVGGASSANTEVNYTMYSTTASTYRFYVGYGGTIYATNTTISAISDQRFKENVRDLDVGLDAIMALKPRKFDWKAGKGKDIKNDRGFIAQEFEQVFPDLIDEWKDPAPEGEEPYKAVRQDLIPVLVKALQELKAEVDSLKSQLKGA